MAGPAMKISIVDKGFGALLTKIEKNNDVRSEIGVIDAEDPETAMIARVHELGLGNNPQRSFMRATVAKNRQRYALLVKRAFAKFMDGDWTMFQAMRAVGEEIRSDIQQAIIKGVPPALKAATIASKRRRGLPRPRTALYASGKLYEAIKLRIKGVR